MQIVVKLQMSPSLEARAYHVAELRAVDNKAP